jgi:hypothetical protein
MKLRLQERSRKTQAAAIKRRKAESRNTFGPKARTLAACHSVKVLGALSLSLAGATGIDRPRLLLVRVEASYTGPSTEINIF